MIGKEVDINRRSDVKPIDATEEEIDVESYDEANSRNNLEVHQEPLLDGYNENGKLEVELCRQSPMS